MPCESFGPDTNLEKADKATRAACEMAKALGKPGIAKLSRDTQKWVREHDEADAERERNEQKYAADQQKRRAAYDKLTSEERSLLGI